ncbi:MAG TPA: transposase [Verrucomicrobiae bacterium]|nr:transposase [Verrucomicrobiae bacterium]
MKKHYRIAPEVKEQILKCIKEEGVSVSQAAKEHGVAEAMIYRWLGEIAGQTSSESFSRSLYYSLFGLACLAVFGAFGVLASWNGNEPTWLQVIILFLGIGVGTGLLGALYIGVVGLFQRHSERRKSA